MTYYNYLELHAYDNNYPYDYTMAISAMHMRRSLHAAVEADPSDQCGRVHGLLGPC